MRVLEDGLDELAAALTSRHQRAMTVFEDDVSTAVRPAMLERISQLAAEIRKVKERYGLAAQFVSNRNRFVARLSSLSVDLTEATSKYMKAYGEVPEDERKPLDDQIGTMIALVEELVSAVTEEPADTN
jgi:HD superfamily phosphohydrolase